MSAGNSDDSSSDEAPKRVIGTPFKPGVSGNPNGRPKIPDEVREMWRDATVPATKRLIEALDAERGISVGMGRDATLEFVPDWDTRLKAIEILYSRQWGKAPQAITTDEGSSIIGLVILPSEST